MRSPAAKPGFLFLAYAFYGDDQLNVLRRRAQIGGDAEVFQLDLAVGFKAGAVAAPRIVALANQFMSSVTGLVTPFNVRLPTTA